MRVCFIPSDFDGPGGYRCMFPAQELSRRGWKAGIPSFTPLTDGKKWHFVIQHPPEADVYVVHRRLERDLLELMRSEKAKGKIIVTSTDDNDLQLPPWLPGFQTERHSDKSRGIWHNLVSLSDHLIVTTPHLKKAYRKLNRQITIIPNFLEWSMWETLKPRDWDRLRVGYMGAYKFRGGDFEVLKPWLSDWLKRNPEVDFVASGCHDAHELLGVPEKQRVSLPAIDFYSGRLPEMLRFDIGLVPLASHPFNESKSHLKGMEYNACGIPCLASPTGPYREWVEDGDNGFLCERASDWVDALDRLVSDPDLLRRMGLAARAQAREHSLDRKIGVWEDFLGSLTEREAVAA